MKPMTTDELKEKIGRRIKQWGKLRPLSPVGMMLCRNAIKRYQSALSVIEDVENDR